MSASTRPRRVIVLGSTGSIGVNTLAVIDHLNRVEAGSFEVVGLAAGRDSHPLAEQAARWSPKAVAVCDAHGRVVAQRFNGQIFRSPDAATQLIEAVDADLVVSAIVGVAGLRPTAAAIARGCDIALANKETLVAAGAVIMPLARQHGVTIIPVDSEHSAVWQCLGESSNQQAIARVVLTASGGPFRDTDPAELYHAPPERALRHPTWEMGPKVTIDSATMMNKALELVEAHHLFNLPPEKLTALIHPQSIVHSFVEFADHSVLAQLGPPDMRTPIQVALTWPSRVAGCSRRLDWSKLHELTFRVPDVNRYPALPLAYRVMQQQGTAGATFNAANEVAVAAYLQHRLPYGRIVALVSEAMDALPPRPLTGVGDALAADAQARAWVEQRLIDEPPPQLPTHTTTRPLPRTQPTPRPAGA